jgi:hypothetical protein
MLKFPVIGQDPAVIMGGSPATGNIHVVAIVGSPVIGDKNILCEN